MWGDGLVAYNAKTGQQIFKNTEQFGFGKVAVKDGLAYYNGGIGEKAIDATTGALVWLQSIQAANAALGNGRAYYGDTPRLDAVDAHTGHIDYALTKNRDLQYGPALANGVLYFPNPLSAYQADDGTLLWSTGANGQACANPIVANGMVYCTDGTELYAYAIDGGKYAAYHANAEPPSFATLHRR